MKYAAASYDIRLLGQALTPSIFSGIFCVTLGTAVVVAIVIDAQLKGSFLPIVFYDWGNVGVGGSGDRTYGILLQEISNRLSTFIVWVIFGTILLLIASSILGAIRQAKRLKTELASSGYRRKSIVADAVWRFVVRSIIVAAWAAYIWVFFAVILSYAISAATIGGSDMPSIIGIGYIVLATLMLVAALFVHVVFLRVLLLRPRVFGMADYIISTR